MYIFEGGRIRRSRRQMVGNGSEAAGDGGASDVGSRGPRWTGDGIDVDRGRKLEIPDGLETAGKFCFVFQVIGALFRSADLRNGSHPGGRGTVQKIKTERFKDAADRHR